MAIWYPASGVTYSQYLQANSFKGDITGQIETSTEAILGEISDQTKQLVASDQELAHRFGEGFNSIDSSLEWGFNRIEYALGGINSSIQSLDADYKYGMRLLLEKVHIHNELLSRMLNKLDAIHKTLESPTLTQAREFYRMGYERLCKGLLDKALEAFTEAEKKNDTDFFTQYHIGKLYLNGIDDDDNVIDYDKAKQHLLLAARYAKAEITVDSSFAKLAAEALLQASDAVYAQLGENHALGNANKSRALLEEAIRLNSEAVKFDPQLCEAHYHISKCSALLGERDSSIVHLNTAITLDRKYAVKVDLDHAFDSIRSDVTSLLALRRVRAGIVSALTFYLAKQLLEILSAWHPEDSQELSSQFYKCRDDLAKAQEHFSSQTYFGFLDAMSLLDQLIGVLPQLKSKRIEELKLQVGQSLRSAKGELPLTGEYSLEVKREIQEINDMIIQAEYQLNLETFEAFKSALALGQSANLKAVSVHKKSREEDEAETRRQQEEKEAAALQEGRNMWPEYLVARKEKRKRWSKKYAAIGAWIGGILAGVDGCVIGLSGGMIGGMTEGIVGAFIGAMAGAIIGALIGQMKSG